MTNLTSTDMLVNTLSEEYQDLKRDVTSKLHEIANEIQLKNCDTYNFKFREFTTNASGMMLDTWVYISYTGKLEDWIEKILNSFKIATQDGLFGNYMVDVDSLTVTKTPIYKYRGQFMITSLDGRAANLNSVSDNLLQQHVYIGVQRAFVRHFSGRSLEDITNIKFSETEGGVQTYFVLILDISYSVESLQGFLKHEVEQHGGRFMYDMTSYTWQYDIKINVSSITIAQLGSECVSHPCQNEGTCTHRLDTTGYSCTCKPHFTGVHCETERPVNKYHGQFKMTSEEYSEALADVTTSAYKTLAAAVRTELLVVYKSSSLGSSVVDVTNIAFSKGSIVADFELLLDDTSSNEALQKVLKDYVEANNGMLGNFAVDPSSIVYGLTEVNSASSNTALIAGIVVGCVVVIAAVVAAAFYFNKKNSNKVVGIHLAAEVE